MMINFFVMVITKVIKPNKDSIAGRIHIKSMCKQSGISTL
jgi:hypothetical protein